MTTSECLLTVPDIVHQFNLSKTTIHAAMADGTMLYLNDNGVKKTTTACVIAWITAQLNNCAPVSSPDKRSVKKVEAKNELKKVKAKNEDFYDHCLKTYTHKRSNN